LADQPLIIDGWPAFNFLFRSVGVMEDGGIDKKRLQQKP